MLLLFHAASLTRLSEHLGCMRVTSSCKDRELVYRMIVLKKILNSPVDRRERLESVCVGGEGNLNEHPLFSRPLNHF